jgi:hypothetical protein
MFNLAGGIGSGMAGASGDKAPTAPTKATGGDTLQNVLMQRQAGNMGSSAMGAPVGDQPGMMGGMAGAMGNKIVQGAAGPTATPSAPNHLPPAWQRFATAQKMQNAYKNNWQPNPVLMGMMGDDNGA